LLDTVSVPDSIQPVVGWRAWIAEVVTPSPANTSTVFLRSIAFESKWSPGTALHAACQDPYNQCERSPGRRCRCGIYALHSAKWVLEAVGRKRRPLVLGRVLLWGSVVPGARGWRAEYAYPKDLFVVEDRARNPELLEGLQAYGVPVQLMSTRELRRQPPTVPPQPHWWTRLVAALSGS
jgi:hypothetical protein